MPSPWSWLTGAAILLISSTAFAVVVQIDGEVVPRGGGTCPAAYVGCCMEAYEEPGAIDPILDARVEPGIFQIPCPTGCDPDECGVLAGCEFYTVNFEVLGEGAGYHNSFGWYNVGDDVTDTTNLHLVLDCRSGGAITCPDPDPRSTTVDFQEAFELGDYDGGFIGMWLRTPELLDGGSDSDGCGSVGDSANRIYFTEQSLNDDGDFVHYLIWESIALDDTYYFGFEDLFRGGDNDFEDMFFVAQGLVPPCDPQPETCNGLDDDCDGEIDEGLTRDCSSACGDGIETCVDGDWSDCDAPLPETEICDGVDNNCNGETDEGLTQPCSNSCGSGTEVCFFGAWVDCDAPLPDTEVCDGVDNDCDDDIDESDPRLGDACGEDRGACEPGAYVCTDGELLCDGGVGPASELCNGIDDDCDGDVDEHNPEGGDSCGTDEGECRPGVETCIAGAIVCTGGRGPIDEVCNGLDDDCDGDIDNGNPGGGAPCGTDIGACEPGVLTCIDGRFECDGATGPTSEECNGIDDDCDGVIDDDLVRDCDAPCGPGNQICVDGEWGPCQGPSGNPEVCNGRDDDCDGEIDEDFDSALCPEDEAECIEGECALPCLEGEFPCPPGKECIDGFCVSGPCRDVDCDEGSICVDGECVDLCGDVQCGDGFVCHLGRCVEDNCYGLGCEPGEICVDGVCDANPCAGVTCPDDQFCRDGDCIESCAGVWCPDGQSCRGGECVDDPCAGITCQDGSVCLDGDCVEDPCRSVSCGSGRVCLDGECVDDPCLHIDCPGDQVCRGGECVGTEPPPQPEEDSWGLATGGGGLTCAVADDSPRAPWLALLVVLGALLLLRRPRRLELTETSPRSKRKTALLGALLLSGAVVVSGCETDPYCFTCEEGSDGDGDADGDADGDGDGDGDSDADGCIYDGEEECDGRDNDCDGQIDEDFDTAIDPRNCGDCGVVCIVPHAFPRCVEGECQIDRCDVGWVDLDRLPGNGCEYECLGSGTEVCDDQDNDCDGDVDEDFDLDTDINNCGACGVICAFYHAAVDCVGGDCVMGECEAGFVDLDGLASTGCEYNCSPSGSGETCDGQDNDCDGDVDEGIDLDNDAENCGACGRVCSFLNASASCASGECLLGDCDDGWIDLDTVADSGCEYPCDGVTAETCNGQDDDCDGLVDEEDPDVGTACGSSAGDCIPGVWVCRAGRLECEGGSSGSVEVCDGEDNDCDGDTDEGNPGGGARCGLTNTGACEWGELVCSGGELVCGGPLIEPTTESCNNVDDDCDGETDEGIAPRACSTRCGSGTEVCEAGAWVDCDAPPELADLCDGEDNNCDGTIDPGCPVVGAAEVWIEADSNNTVFPNLASNGATRAVVTYLHRPGSDAQVRVAGSSDAGTSWSAPADTRLDGNASGDDATTPVVAMAGGQAYIAWEDTRDGDRRSIYLRRSVDNGVTWEGSTTRLDVGIADDCFDIDIAAVGDDVYVVWQAMDWADRSRSIYFVGSTDGGATFSSPVEIDRHDSDELGISRNPTIAADTRGTVVVAYADNRHGPLAIYVNSSSDSGATWLADDIRLDPSTVEAESQSPVVAIDGSYQIVVAWEDEAPDGLDTKWKIYAAVSTDGGETFGDAVRLDDDPLPHDSREPAIAIDPLGDAAHVVWRDMRNGLADIYLRSLDLVILDWDATSTRIDTNEGGEGNSTMPRVTAGDDGRVWVVWADDRSGQRDIYLNFSLDGGAVFQPLDLRLDSDVAGSADSHDPRIAVTDAGVVVVWVDHRAGDGTSGDLYARTVE